MHNFFIRKNFVLNSFTILSFLIFVFFTSHIFFSDRSIWKIFLLNSQISAYKKEYNELILDKEKIISEIDLLRDNNLDFDYITEISHKTLGLIQSDQIVLEIKN